MPRHRLTLNGFRDVLDRVGYPEDQPTSSEAFDALSVEDERRLLLDAIARLDEAEAERPDLLRVVGCAVDLYERIDDVRVASVAMRRLDSAVGQLDTDTLAEARAAAR